MAFPISDVHSSRLPHLPLERVSEATRPRVRGMLDQYMADMSTYISGTRKPGPDGHWAYGRFDHLGLDPDFEVFVVREGRDVAGFVFLDVRRDGIEIAEMYIEPSYRRRGLGTLVVNAIKQMAEDRRVRYVIARVLRPNTRAITFWRRQDFEYASPDLSQNSEVYLWPKTTRPQAISGSW